MESTWEQSKKVAISSGGRVAVTVQEALQRGGFWTNVTFHCCF